MTRGRPCHFIFSCLLLAVLLRALIPAGFMPDLGGITAGRIDMVICTANGVETVSLPGDFDPEQKPPHQKTDNPLCPFSAGAQAFHIPALAFVFILLSVATLGFWFSRQKSFFISFFVSARPREPPHFKTA